MFLSTVLAVVEGWSTKELLAAVGGTASATIPVAFWFVRTVSSAYKRRARAAEAKAAAMEKRADDAEQARLKADAKLLATQVSLQTPHAHAGRGGFSCSCEIGVGMAPSAIED